MSDIDFAELHRRFRAGTGVSSIPIEQCLRCKRERQFTLSVNPQFPQWGEQVYHYCPSCYENKLYPWDGWFVLTETQSEPPPPPKPKPASGEKLASVKRLHERWGFKENQS